MTTICVLDYGVGNLRSIANALTAAGADVSISADVATAESAHGLVVPGVGAFPHVAAKLRQSGLEQAVLKRVSLGRPVLGVCVGMQMLFSRGLEFEVTAGLGLIPGSVERMADPASPIRLPHIAWTEVRQRDNAAAGMFAGLDPARQRFYFLHSFCAFQVPDEYVAATADYEQHTFVAAVRSGTLWGTQFHPEKSGEAGQQFLRNFIALCDGSS